MNAFAETRKCWREIKEQIHKKQNTGERLPPDGVTNPAQGALSIEGFNLELLLSEDEQRKASIRLDAAHRPNKSKIAQLFVPIRGQNSVPHPYLEFYSQSSLRPGL